MESVRRLRKVGSEGCLAERVLDLQGNIFTDFVDLWKKMVTRLLCEWHKDVNTKVPSFVTELKLVVLDLD